MYGMVIQGRIARTSPAAIEAFCACNLWKSCTAATAATTVAPIDRINRMVMRTIFIRMARHNSNHRVCELDVGAQLIAPVSYQLAQPGDWRNQLRSYLTLDGNSTRIAKWTNLCNNSMSLSNELIRGYLYRHMPQRVRLV